MKKILLVVMTVVLAVATLAGCEDSLERKISQGAENLQTDNANTNVDLPEKSKVEVAVENPIKEKPVAEKPVTESLATAPDAKPSADNKTPKVSAPDKSSFIDEEAAKEIALKRAGLSVGQVIFEKTELDRDDGVWLYEIEFRQNKIEYDVEVKADDGKILSFEKDID